MMKSFSDFFNEGKEAEAKPTQEVDEMAIRHADTAEDHLDRELAFIENDDLRNFITEYLDKSVPDYFWTEAGAKNAIHHPAQDTGVGGLIRHTRMCCAVAIDLLNNDLFAKIRDKQDEIIAALICHDTKKNGNDNVRYSREHPTHAGASIAKFYREGYDGPKSAALQSSVELISDCVSKHMGPNFNWRRGWKPEETILPYPDNPFASFVHLCDYIASRKFIGDLKDYDDYSSRKKSIADSKAMYDKGQAGIARKRAEREQARAERAESDEANAVS